MNKEGQIESIMLVFILVAASMIVVFPLSAPKVKAVTHLASAQLEDGNPDYDMDGDKNNIVVWSDSEDHIINTNYLVNPGYTLNIPALNYSTGAEGECEISFESPGKRIEVDGTLITNSDGDMFTKTLFQGPGFTAWEGIFFHAGSQGRIVDSIIKGATIGILFEPGSKMLPPGVMESHFTDMMQYGLKMDGVSGYTNVDMTGFSDTLNFATALDVANGCVNLSLVTFDSHRNDQPALKASNAQVNVYYSWFKGNYRSGNIVHIEGDSNETVFTECWFEEGSTDEHYIRVDGCSPLLSDCSFDTSGGELSLIANEDAQGVPAHPILRQPTSDGLPGMWDDTFDNNTLNATGDSSITLQWYMNVFVKDPDGNAVRNAPVWIKDRYGNPGDPPSLVTDTSGWANTTLVTELILYEGWAENFNPYNVSSLNNSVFGFADPKPSMDMSKEINITVEFSLIPNTLPVYINISTPEGVQNRLVEIEYKLVDPNMGDDGNLSVEVYFWDDELGIWKLATPHLSSDPTSQLNNDTLYRFVWDSKDGYALGGRYSEEVYLKVIPYDRAGNGTPFVTDNFTVDNYPPVFLTLPTVTVTNTTALIEWEVNESANASVYYGFNVDFTWDDITDMETGTILDTSQSVLLTDLLPGRNYTFYLKSEDKYKNAATCDLFSFVTKLRIQLYEGWNMISLPPLLLDSTVEDVLESINGSYDIVQAYKAVDTNDSWKHYLVGKPFGNDLTVIHHEMGLWIHMLNDDVLIPDHNDPTSIPNSSSGVIICLELGWNFVGYPSLKTRTIEDALTNVPCDFVQHYDVISDQWLYWDGTSGDLTHMEMGRGYWIHCENTYDWYVNYV